MMLPNPSGFSIPLYLSIVMEFANNGDLAYRIEVQEKEKLALHRTRNLGHFFIQIVKGLTLPAST
jgi:hypothetical protein